MAANKYGNNPIAIYPGDTATIWNAEAAVSGDRSPALPIGRSAFSEGPLACAVELQFSADPGALQIDAQDADSDSDLAYQNIAAGQVKAVDANFRARVEFQCLAQLLRIKCTTITNAVNLTLKVTR